MKKTFTTKTVLTIFTTVLLNLTLAAQNTIKTDSIIQLSTCAGGNILVRFAATGSYPNGNKFIAQLSNASGQFNNPIEIGQIPFNTGVLLGVIPKSANFGFLYKIRVIATNPATIGTPCPNTLIITQVAELNKIIAYPNDTICERDSVKLTSINIASSYKWSTGETTPYITVKKGGVYSVTTTDPLSCESTANITVTVRSCQSGVNESALGSTFRIYPNPASDVIYSDKFQTALQANYQILNSIGQTVKEGVAVSNSITIGDLKDGIYFIRIVKGQESYQLGKFIKKQH